MNLKRDLYWILSSPGKHIGRLGHQDPGEFPEEVKALFEKAVEYYEENMALMVEIQVSEFWQISWLSYNWKLGRSDWAKKVRQF